MELFGETDVIDEADSSCLDSDAAYRATGVGPLADGLEREGVDNLVVLDDEEWVGVDLLDCPLGELGWRHGRDLGDGGGENLVDVRSRGSVLWCEECVARADGETVGLAYNRAVDDFELEVALADHLSDDGNLLEILLAEICLVGRHVCEELGDDLAHAIEVTWAMRTFHDLGYGTEVELSGVWGRVYLLDRGGEDDVGFGVVAQQLNIGVEGSWVCTEVVGVVELRGVDKHADDDEVALIARAGYEREVPDMEGAHCWHETDRLAVLTSGGNACFKFGYCAYYFHLEYIFPPRSYNSIVYVYGKKMKCWLK